jgi:hypothetical protein
MRAAIGFTGALGWLLVAVGATAGPVSLRHGDTVGKGFAFLAGGQCVILTAAHVVDGAFEPVQLAADGYRGKVDAGQWTLERTHDLAFATLPAAGFASCREPLEEPTWMRPFRPAPSAEFRTEVRQANDRTEILRFRFDGATSRDIELTTLPGRRSVEQGDSGSLITLDGRPVAILTNVQAGSPQVMAKSIDLAFALWRNSLLPVAAAGPMRIPVRLEAAKVQGQDNATMRAFAEERIQNERGFQLSRNPAEQACRVSLDLVNLSLANQPNPLANVQCSPRGLLGQIGYNLCLEQRRSAPRRLFQYQGLVTATVTLPDGQMQVINMQRAGQLAPALTDQRAQQFEGVRAALAESAGEVLRRGACGKPAAEQKPARRR